MSAGKETIVIDSDDSEPLPKKQKQERLPLVVLSNDSNTKKKQLTLKDMVSSANKTKQANLKTMLISPKVAQKSNKAKFATLNRGIKRKSTFSGEIEVPKTPVKQAASDVPNVDVVTPPSLESVLKRSPESKTNGADQETDKSPESKSAETVNDPKEITKPPSGKEPMKKKLGDIKKKQPVDKPTNSCPKITQFTTKASPKTPVTCSLPPTCYPVKPPEATSPSTSCTLEEKAKENKSPIKVQDDNEKPGPSRLMKTPISEKKPRAMTPKQKRLQEEREKKRTVRDKTKENERIAKEQAKELEKKAKDDAKKKKDAEKEAEKMKKEEKEIERKRKLHDKEEEKRQEEEEQEKKRQKKLREQEKFKSFFSAKKVVAPAKAVVTTLEKKFRDFVITPNMSVAPINRIICDPVDILLSRDSWENNLEHIKKVITEMKSRQRTNTDALSSDLQIISIFGENKVRVTKKVLMFYENHRPAYCGSWRKKSDVIGPRRPFGQDKVLFDYDYDSDEDWEEEEEGEDITTEKEEDKEEEKDDDDDEDDGFLVPHGYLSDDEGDEDCELSEDAKKKRMEQRRKQFDEEQKSKESGVLKAKIIGPAWQGEPCTTDAVALLAKFKAVWLCEDEQMILDPFAREQPVAMLETSENVKKELPVEGYTMLIKFMHGSPIGLSRAVERFQELWHSEEKRSKVSKRQLTQLIPSLMKKTMRPGNFMKLCWYAPDDTLTKHGLTDLVGLHCQEQVFITPPPPPLSPSTNTIHKFTKTLTSHQALLENSKLIAQLKIQQLAAQQVAAQHAAAQHAAAQQSAAQHAAALPQHHIPVSLSIATFLAPKPVSSVVSNGVSVIQNTTAAKRRILLTPVTANTVAAKRVNLVPISTPILVEDEPGDELSA